MAQGARVEYGEYTATALLENIATALVALLVISLNTAMAVTAVTENFPLLPLGPLQYLHIMPLELLQLNF